MNPRRVDFGVFTLALSLRVGSTILAAFRITPYSREDPLSYMYVASEIAASVQTGMLAIPDVSYTQRMWGLYLTPFWLLPIPSAQVARITNALLGAIAVYNVYLIANRYHSRRAGLTAALPMALFPTHVLLHGTLMRDTVIIFGLTTIVRLVVVHSSHRRRIRRYAIVALVGAVITPLRPDNLPLYILVVAIGIVVFWVDKYRLDRPLLRIGTIGATIVGGSILLIHPYTRSVLRYLANIRLYRARESAVYLPEVVPVTIPGAISVSWILIMYFLYAPFPWMVSSVGGIVVTIEGMILLLYTIAGFYGVRYLLHRHPRTAIPLAIGLIIGITLYAFGTANYGAASRFRQTFTWVIFIFGGIGIAHYVRFRCSLQSLAE